jgi:hypothetical protein
MAWIAWRTKEALRAFQEPDGSKKWQDALAGKYPPGLGRPRMMTPQQAQADLERSVKAGEVRPIDPPRVLH